MTAAAVLGIVCGALFVLLVVASILLCCSLNMSVAEAKRIRADVIAGALKAAQKLPSEKPDAAKECGVVKPQFDEKSPLFRKIEIRAEAKGQPRRMGKHKVRIYFYEVTELLHFHNLAEFYRNEGVRKCEFSPSRKMDEDDRLAFIAARIVFFYSGRGLTVRAVSLYRKKRWHAFEYDEKGFRK